MSDGPLFEAECREFARRVDDWSIEAGVRDMPEALRKQGRLLALQCARSSPPRKDNSSPRPSSDGQAESARRDAFTRIDRSLRKIFSVGGTNFVEHIAKIHGTTGINVWLTQKNAVRVNLQWDQILFNPEQMRDFHFAHVKNGRPQKTWRVWKGSKSASSKWQAKAVVCREDAVKYAEQVKANLGRVRASWAIPYLRLGGAQKQDWKIPKWVEKHISGAKGIVNDANLKGMNPELIIGSNAKGVGLLKPLMIFALRARMAAMKTDMGLYIKGTKKRFEQ